jgi:hypothetical protein
VQICDTRGNCASILNNSKGWNSLNVTPTNPYIR